MNNSARNKSQDNHGAGQADSGMSSERTSRYIAFYLGVHMIINESDATDIQADIEGPVGTPYEGGVFRCKLAIEHDFPTNPPKGYFVTKIFHPNVSEKGEICVNTLKKDWNPAAWSLHNILEVN